MDYVIFHNRGNSYCADGLYAAYAASLALPEAILVPQLYPFDKSPIVPQSGDSIYCVDICPTEHVAKQWVATGASLRVLDHHPISLSVGFLLKDVNRSGAVISWEYFHPGQPIPEIFQYVQDRDLWRKQLPNCDLVSLAISELSYKQPIEVALEMCRNLTVSEPQQLPGQDIDFYRRCWGDADPKEAQGEVFFSQLSRSEWRSVAEYLQHCMPICLTDRETFRILTEFLGLIQQFAGDDADKASETQ